MRHESSFHGVVFGVPGPKSYWKALFVRCWTGPSPHCSVDTTIRAKQEIPHKYLTYGKCYVWLHVWDRRPLWMDKPFSYYHTGTNGFISSFGIPSERLDTYTCPVEECKPRTFISSCWERSALELCHGQRLDKPQPASRLSTHTVQCVRPSKCLSLFILLHVDSFVVSYRFVDFIEISAVDLSAFSQI